MRTSISDLWQMKQRGERIAMLTCYDATFAKLIEAAGVRLILVGDSLGNNVLGYETTVQVTIDDIVRHTAAVVRGTQSAMVVADLPFLTYGTVEEAINAARRLLQEGGAHAVKLEGGAAMVEIVQRLTASGVPVMGHLGYTPQSALRFGKVRVQAKTSEAARALVEDALALDAAGAFGIVLELIPAPLAAEVTKRVRGITIGIGAGVACDGEVQVLYDLLGMHPDFMPRHARRFATLAETIQSAVATYLAAVADRSFPAAANSSTMDPAALEAALAGLALPDER